MMIKLDDDDYIRYLSERTGQEEEMINEDPVYKVFLEHLREEGEAYTFEMINEDHGSPVIVKYEEENEQTNPDSTYFVRRDNSSTLKRWTKRFCSKSGGISPTISNNQSEIPLEEASYSTFLSHLRYEGSYMVLEIDSVSIKYEEEREASDSSEILADESNRLVPYGSNQPFDLTVYEDGNSLIVSDDECCEVTDFKTKLMLVLKKPYNQAEYEKLLREATERKPITKQKHLRSMSISYETDEVGQSYLDHFPDLAEQMRSADRQDRLDLLRGFFFWLKNLSHEGAYMPWASSGYEVITTDDCEVVLPLDIARD